MILQALTNYYEAQAEKGKIARPGWANVKVSWAVELAEDGKVVGVLPLLYMPTGGKKLIPSEKLMPAPVKRSSGVLPNFLWDNSSYIFGIDNKGKPERSEECFLTAKALHLKLLDSVSSPAAMAVKSFYTNWDCKKADRITAIAENREELISGGNITFFFDGAFVVEDPEVQHAWQKHFDQAAEGELQQCLITGEYTVPESIHPAIKNVRDAQSSGAALVSFNAPAFCSYGKEQNENAPVSKYAAFAYTSALNQLLADRSHVKVIGNTTVVYWAEDAEDQYQDAFSALLEGASDDVTNDDLDALMESVANGKEYYYDGLPVRPDNEFYILGISPNASRLSVRFFYHSSFGKIVRNLKRHYDDIFIIEDGRNKWKSMPLWALLRETVNQKSSDKKPLPQLAGRVMESMISGGRYPETVLNQTILRIRAEKDITRGRAGIIKAYLIRNSENLADKKSIWEVACVSLKEESQYTPYVLGRLFAVLEGVQQAANPGINATIKDRYFNSACATPAVVFPILMKLSNSHLKKLETGKVVFWSKQIGDLTNKLPDSFPTHLSLQEQGTFILGYYHQTQKRFEKKATLNNQEEN